MNQEQRKALFAQVHSDIYELSKDLANDLIENKKAEPTYPPGIEVSMKEQELLQGLNIPTECSDVLQKIIADACSNSILSLLSLLDGVTDPYVIEDPNWVGGSIGGEENELMLHDQFYETYWEYDERKK
jgi:hypothetical protein